MDLAEIMKMESHGPDTWVAAGPRYPWGGLYGGQIVAQALSAAFESVEPPLRVHSLHAFFIRPGNHEHPVRYEVDRIRDGRSFVTRRVVARQSVGALLNMSASFTTETDEGDTQPQVMPEVPAPESLDGESWSSVFERRYAAKERPRGCARAWLRVSDSIGDDPRSHATALAYLSDDMPTEAVINAHPDRPEVLDPQNWPFWSASLDHAIWFHRPLVADAWHLHDFTCRAFSGSRGLSIGNVFDVAGTHVATVSQEVLLRPRRDG